MGAADRSRLYGEVNPALVFATQIGGDGVASFHADLAEAGFELSTLATVQSDVGGYAIGLTGTNGNYAVTFTPGTLAVSPRAVTIAADDLGKRLGEPDPALTWAITGGSLASFDTAGAVFSGGLTRDLGEGVGSYDIGQGTLAANANYALTFVNGTLTIVPVAATVASLFERALPLSVQTVRTEGGDPAPCNAGVLPEEKCAVHIHPANRGLDHVRFAR